MTPIDSAWLAAFDAELLYLFAIDHQDAGMDAFLMGCYADLPPREAAFAVTTIWSATMRFGHALGWA